MGRAQGSTWCPWWGAGPALHSGAWPNVCRRRLSAAERENPTWRWQGSAADRRAGRRDLHDLSRREPGGGRLRERETEINEEMNR